MECLHTWTPSCVEYDTDPETGEREYKMELGTFVAWRTQMLVRS